MRTPDEMFWIILALAVAAIIFLIVMVQMRRDNRRKP